MVSFARVLEKGDEGVSMEEEDLFMRSMKKVKEDQKEKGNGDDVSYADNEGCSPYVQSKGGNMEDVVFMYEVKDNSVLEEVPKESLNTMDQKLDEHVIPLSDVELIRWASPWLNTLVVNVLNKRVNL
ncbi:hypothetical protein JHK87_027121 [Glycine soja]|nr:hypothetical protein JHK87_027121 [Glycine soja]